MKFAYTFSNLIGSVYRKGNIVFTPSGNSVISPVGNRVTLFDLKKNVTQTFPVESKLNITALALSPDGSLLIAVNEEGEAMLISINKGTVLSYYHFHSTVHCISFSPDGKMFAVTKDNNILLYYAPGKTKEFNPFVLRKSFYGAYDETVSVDWTSNSNAFCVGSKDMNTRVYGSEKYKNLIIYSLGGHTDSIINAFFEEDSLDVYSLSRNGQLCIWECDTDLNGLVKDDSDEILETNTKLDSEKDINKNIENKILYKRSAKHKLKEMREGMKSLKLTSAAFHKATHILCTGFDDGSFFLHEMPEFNLIHSLNISDQVIQTISFNSTGDWIAIGCGGLGQLLVWEWQSESYVLKQQGHFNNMSCVVYSPDGQYVVTGGDDAKIKVWTLCNGFCFVTFTEHSAGITDVAFSQNGQVIVSSSLDGTVRAFDLNRYRNFRTFTSPTPAQFSCLALDSSGEIICAGARDVYDVFVWSMQTGRLLDILSGHEGPVSSVSFSPSTSMLASASWDKSIILWDVFESKSAKETINLPADVLSVSFKPDGKELAISCLNSQVLFWDINSMKQIASIEGRHDLGYSRKDEEKITAKSSKSNKAFTSICYSADGESLLAAGMSKNICIYNVQQQLLMKKFEVTCNLSLDGMVEFLDRKKMSEFGNISLIDENENKALSLPGVKKGDFSSRAWKPEMRVFCVKFSPTGRSWAAATTEGLLIYSLDNNMIFDPYDLEIEITPISVEKSMTDRKYMQSLILAFRLNEQEIIQKVIENIPVNEIEHVSSNLPFVYVQKLLDFIANQLETSCHLDFYLRFSVHLLYLHGSVLKQNLNLMLPSLTSLQKSVTQCYQDVNKMCENNKYSIQFLLSLYENRSKRKLEIPEQYDNNEDDDIDNDMNN